LLAVTSSDVKTLPRCISLLSTFFSARPTLSPSFAILKLSSCFVSSGLEFFCPEEASQGHRSYASRWGTTVTDYLNRFPINWAMNWEDNPNTADLVDCKTAQEWVLFGDPSLKIGGYP